MVCWAQAGWNVLLAGMHGKPWRKCGKRPASQGRERAVDREKKWENAASQGRAGRGRRGRRGRRRRRKR